MIQVDELAFREALATATVATHGRPITLRWAVECFRLATGSAGDTTAIHTHMCYSEFNDIMDAIAAMDADAISIEEATRSRMELLDAFSPPGRGWRVVIHGDRTRACGTFIRTSRARHNGVLMTLLGLARQKVGRLANLDQSGLRP